MSAIEPGANSPNEPRNGKETPAGRLESETQPPRRILALEAYYGGSHRAVLDTWRQHSHHEWTLLTLPARHWKWRMRASAIWFAEQLRQLPAEQPDVIFTSDMTAVADLRALLPEHLRRVPIICYFHENQLTYPLSEHDWRDYQYGFTNLTSALVADEVWFNSHAHRSAFEAAIEELLRRMNDYVPRHVLQQIREKTRVVYPPVELPPSDLASMATNRADETPLTILWNHRWEYDKQPEVFFQAMIELAKAGVDFRIVVVGEQFRTEPAAFKTARDYLENRIHVSGFVPERNDYWKILAQADVVVSTAIQENFGLAVLEGILAGCMPLLPNRLSYPELVPEEMHAPYLYDAPENLLSSLKTLASRPRFRDEMRVQISRLIASIRERFGAASQAGFWDHAVDGVVRNSGRSS